MGKIIIMKIYVILLTRLRDTRKLKTFRVIYDFYMLELKKIE